jgi:hypothetical protein
MEFLIISLSEKKRFRLYELDNKTGKNGNFHQVDVTYTVKSAYFGQSA